MPKLNFTNSKLIRGTNDSTVINIIRQKGPISRADIAKYADMTAPTVTNVTNRLLESNLIIEYKMGKSSGGRRPILLKTNPDTLNVIVIYIGSNKMTGYLADGNINIIKRKEEKLRGYLKDEIIDLLLKIIGDLKSRAKAQIPGIGVVLHGPVKSREGISVVAPNLGWKHVPIKYIVEEKYKIPTFVENDSRATALGEFYYGNAKNKNSMVFLFVDYGMGSGVVLDGKLYRGVSDSAGEVGHTTIDINGPKCSCGNYGCLEAMASERALVRNMTRSIKEGRTSKVIDLASGNLDDIAPEDIYKAAKMGDELAKRELRQLARYLGIGVANVLNTFNPEVVLIGGGLARARLFIEDVLIDTVKQRTLESCRNVSEIRFDVMGEEATVKGAADIVLTKLL